MWWCQAVVSRGRVTWWSQVVESRGGVMWWCHVVVSCAGVTWWCHVVVSRGGVMWWSHVVVSRGEVKINNKVLSLSMFCYNMKLIPSIIAKIQPVTAKTKSRSLMSEGKSL
jgi:hypothetical protein